MHGHTSLVVKNEDVFKKIKEIAFREGKDISELTFEMYEKYIKEHGDGNPIYSLDKFQDPDFKICPALFSKHNSWVKYFQSLNHNEKVDFERQFEMLRNAYNSS